MFISSEHYDKWDDEDLHDLKKLTANDFEVVDSGKSIVPNRCGGGECPVCWPMVY